MKQIGESVFDVLYLIFAIGIGVWIIIRKRNKKELLMGISAVVLGLGDAFHLVPRVIGYYSDADLSFYLGTGKLITSVTMTVFYVLLYHIYLLIDGVEERYGRSIAVYALALVRVLLCMAPDNNWFNNQSPLSWAIYRNIPFTALGVIVIICWFSVRAVKPFERMWLYMTLSFAFYIPVAALAQAVPLLGMLMIPKTVCYALILVCFVRSIKNRQTDPLTDQT